MATPELGPHATTSSGESEVFALGQACKSFMWAKYVLEDMAFEFPTPLQVGVDATTALAFTRGGYTPTSKLRHVRQQQQWVQDIRGPLFTYVHVPTDSNKSDLGTKQMGGVRFQYLRSLVMKPLPAAIQAIYDAGGH